MDGMVDVTSLGVTFERGARLNGLARMLTVIQLGRELLREIELGAVSPAVGVGLIPTLNEARRRVEDIGALQVA